MSEEYVFPENNWYIEVDNKNKYILSDWKSKQFYDEDLLLKNGNLNYEFIEYDGAGTNREDRFLRIKLIKITTEQFLHYVLKEELPITNDEDFTYLIIFLNKLKIK